MDKAKGFTCSFGTALCFGVQSKYRSPRFPNNAGILLRPSSLISEASAHKQQFDGELLSSLTAAAARDKDIEDLRAAVLLRKDVLVCMSEQANNDLVTLVNAYTDSQKQLVHSRVTCLVTGTELETKAKALGEKATSEDTCQVLKS